MSRDHLERRGFKPNPVKIEKGKFRIAGTITGRRARKEWLCAAKDCMLQRIEWDEVYVETREPLNYAGPVSVSPPQRFHLPCAIRHELIVKDETKTEVTNRRGAIAMMRERAKRGEA